MDPERPLEITKFVAIVADDQAENPEAEAVRQVREAWEAGYERLRQAHEQAWAELWQQGIDVPRPRSQKLINASLYHIHSSLREGTDWSLAPCGLSGNGWDGHIFWDADTWIYPVVALFHPSLGRCFTEYRRRSMEGYRREAAAEGMDGIRVAWMSGECGDEGCSLHVYREERHINSCAALAQWQQWLLTGDERHLRDCAAPVILESAAYWASRAEWNAQATRWEIRRVCGPDEHAQIVDNNACTNNGAAWTLRKAADLASKLGIDAPVDHWRGIAEGLWIPYDAKRRLFLEFEGWNDDRVIKQADTSLMVYPWQMEMDEDEKRNLVGFYRKRYPNGKIMMGSAIDGVVDCELGDAASAWASFLELLPHYREPFLMASESPRNNVMNFLTGLGGLLQLVCMGFAGVRIREDGLLVEPCLPAGWDSMRLRGVRFRGFRFDVSIADGGKSVHIENLPQSADIRIYRRSGAEVPRR